MSIRLKDTIYDLVNSASTATSATTAGTADVATIARSLGTNNSIKMYVQNNDEINFGGSPTNGSTTIYVGYKSADSRTVPTAYVFGGSDGSATITSNGFIKKGSSSSYVLLGNGGHKAISDFAASSHTHTKSQITDFPTSMPASDVYAWAKASTKPSYNFGEIGAGIATIGDGANRIMWRTNTTWSSGVYYSTPNNESVVFANKNSSTSWMFVTGDPTAQASWETFTPSLQIKNQRVTINKAIATGTNAEYNLDVNGSFNATSGYINKNAIIHAGNIGSQSVSYATSAGDADTLDGTHLSGIIQYYTSSSTNILNLNDLKSTSGFQVAGWAYAGAPYVNNQPAGDGASSAATVIKFPGTYPFQIYRFYSSNDIKVRGYYSGTGWTSWATILTSDNYTSYTVKKDGTGASGTWGISISGNAATATSATSATNANYATSASSATTAGSADVATIARSLGTDNSIKAYAQLNNEFNFGGTNNSSTIYFGYRAVDSKPIPTAFVFGSSTGTATLTASGYKKKDSSDSYVLLGGGGHKAVSDFSMSHSHPYLPTAGGTMTGTIYFTDTAAACLTFGSMTSSKLKGITLPSMGSNGIGLFSRYGKSTDEGGIILTEDTCLVYNSGDTGWQFQVHDKDLNQTDLSGTNGDGTGTRVFGTLQADYCAWSRGGFQKSGSSNSYVLLGGGGHKAVSDFATSGHTHSGYLTSLPSHTHDYLPLAGGTMNAGVRIGHAGTGIYLGNSANNGWIYTQDMCSQDGHAKWCIYTNGSAYFQSIYLGGEQITFQT